METIQGWKQSVDSVTQHGSYLQGMETPEPFDGPGLQCVRTDPTYKEWKLGY